MPLKSKSDPFTPLLGIFKAILGIRVETHNGPGPAVFDQLALVSLTYLRAKESLPSGPQTETGTQVFSFSSADPALSTRATHSEWHLGVPSPPAFLSFPP